MADNRSECMRCLASSYSVMGSGAISNCYCNVGWSGVNGKCSRCVPGKFNPNEGAVACTACAAGAYLNTSALSCVYCTAGKYSADDRSEGIRCPANSYSVIGSGAISNCYCNAGSLGANGECRRCVPGKFNPNDGAVACTACAAGAYSNTSALSCVYCAAGKYSAHDRSECIWCLANSYFVSRSANITFCSCNAGSLGANGKCSRCVPGKFKPNEGAGECTACAGGTYSNTAALSCVDCAAGSYSAHDNSKRLSCPANAHSTIRSGAVEACLCNAGWWKVNKNSPALHVCMQMVQSCWITGTMASIPNCGCPADQYEVSISCVYCLPTHVYCTDCPANSNFVSGSNNITACSCNAVWTGSNAYCTACVSGKYKASSGSEECTDCALDSYAHTDRTTCLSCPANTYSAGGSGAITACSSSQCGHGGIVFSVDATRQCITEGTAGPCSVYTKGSSGDADHYLLDGNVQFNSHDGNTWAICMDCPQQLYSSANIVIDLGHSYDVRSVTVWAGYQGEMFTQTQLSLSDTRDGHNQESCSGGVQRMCSTTPEQWKRTHYINCASGTTGRHFCIRRRQAFVYTTSQIYLQEINVFATLCHCAAGSFSTDDERRCKRCPENSFSDAMSNAVTACSCIAGWTGTNGICVGCVPGKYKQISGSGACTECATGKMSNISSQTCSVCDHGSYPTDEKSKCNLCPTNSGSLATIINISRCSCNPGSTERNCLCEACVPGKN